MCGIDLQLVLITATQHVLNVSILTVIIQNSSTAGSRVTHHCKFKSIFCFTSKSLLSIVHINRKKRKLLNWKTKSVHCVRTCLVHGKWKHSRRLVIKQVGLLWEEGNAEFREGLGLERVNTDCISASRCVLDLTLCHGGRKYYTERKTFKQDVSGWC